MTRRANIKTPDDWEEQYTQAFTSADSSIHISLVEVAIPDDMDSDEFANLQLSALTKYPGYSRIGSVRSLRNDSGGDWRVVESQTREEDEALRQLQAYCALGSRGYVFTVTVEASDWDRSKREIAQVFSSISLNNL
jgi:hypothetical protein